MKKKKPIVVAVSGGFDPLRIGHIEMFKAAKALGDKLIVILNCDQWLIRKKGRYFMNQKERAAIVKELKPVDQVYIHRSKKNDVCGALKKIRPDIFGNGGDRRTKKDIPEDKICEELGIKMIFGLGKKIQSSSELVKRYRLNK